MQDTQEAKKVKDRSPTFPFISLERAIERARQFYTEEKRGVAPFARAVMHWKYTEASSGGLQTVAALKSYGLLVDAGGSGKARQLQLTELALRIVLDTRPDSTERDTFIEQAARSPTVAAEVYERWPDGLPSDATLNHFLVLDKKFNEGTARIACRILKENQVLAKMDKRVVQSEDREPEDEETMESGVQIQVPDPTKKATFKLDIPSGKPTPFTEQLLSLDGKITTTLHFSDTPSVGVYRWIETYAKMKADSLAEAATRQSTDGKDTTATTPG